MACKVVKLNKQSVFKSTDIVMYKGQRLPVNYLRKR